MTFIHRNRLKLFSVATCLLLYSVRFVRADSLPTCLPADFHYEFTECDDFGGRWRVSVPQPGICIQGAPNPPTRINSCSQACDPGQYLNVTNLKCELCLPGFYSLGGGERFEEWLSLPKGFTTHVDNVQNQNCSNSTWLPRGDFIASTGIECTSYLIYSAKLVKPGAVRYKYQHADDSTMFSFRVQNDRCRTIDDSLNSKWPGITENGEWKEEVVLLKTGLNILYWKVSRIKFDVKNSKPVMVKMIEVNGLAYASSCTPCPSGTYSLGNASSCTPCPVNTFSGKGFSKCTECDANNYSFLAADKCIARPPCTYKDYFSVNMPCDENKMTQKNYKWIEPKICRDDLINATKLPLPGAKQICPPCNPGMQTNSTIGDCTFCPKNHYSDGKQPCEICPPSTIPNYGYQYIWWNSWPVNVQGSCFKLMDDNCPPEKGWVLAGDHICGGKDLADDMYFTLSLTIPGFQGRDSIHAGKATEISRVSFVFELNCNSSCQMYFMQSRKKSMAVIQSWTGRQEKQQFTYVITNNRSMSFMWAFQKVEWDRVLSSNNKFSFINDTIKIFSINVTNTVNGGATYCQPCPQSISESSDCIHCPPGQYINNSSTCAQCPPSTFVTDYMPKGVESCQPCGPNLYSTDGQGCYSNCIVKINNKTYNLTPISDIHKIVGSLLFTASGTEYYHIFNISLCGIKSTCKDNVTYEFDNQEESVGLKAFVCRTTIIPAKGSEDPTVATQSISLGDTLLGITSDLSLANMSARLIQVTDISEMFDKAPDINFYYTSSEVTRACPNGRSTVITLRCDTKIEGNGSLHLPHDCPYGTCDGCNFNILWSSKYACPVCTEEDYDIVKSECLKGEQSIHYIPPKYCQISDSLNKLTKTVKCTVLVFEIQLLIIAASVLAFVLIILLICLWKKNRKLEYKYMRLVQSANAKDGELPKAESCAIDEGEDEDHFDAVQFQESKGKKLFNKLKSMTKKDGSNPFETIQLTSEKDSLS